MDTPRVSKFNNEERKGEIGRGGWGKLSLSYLAWILEPNPRAVTGRYHRASLIRSAAFVSDRSSS